MQHGLTCPKVARLAATGSPQDLSLRPARPAHRHVALPKAAVHERLLADKACVIRIMSLRSAGLWAGNVAALGSPPALNRGRLTPHG